MWGRSLLRLVAPLLLAVSTTAWAQGGVSTGTIIGVARERSGTFPEQVLVNLYYRGAPIATSYSDPEGRFGFYTLAPGEYHVVISDDRYAPLDTRVVIRPDALTVNMLQLTLVPLGPKADPKAPAGSYVTSPAGLTRTYPKNAVKELERGIRLENEGKPDEAIEHYRKAVKEAPDFALAHNNLGSLYLGKSDFPAAQKEFQETMRLDPGDSKAYFNMANLMLLSGKLQDAERYLQDGFRKQPDSAFGFFVQGSVLERTGKLGDAERALQRALELNPKLTRPHLELVNLYLRAQRRTDAISELQKFLQVAPTDPFAPKAREVLNRLQSSSPSPPHP